MLYKDVIKFCDDITLVIELYRTYLGVREKHSTEPENSQQNTNSTVIKISNMCWKESTIERFLDQAQDWQLLCEYKVEEKSLIITIPTKIETVSQDLKSLKEDINHLIKNLKNKDRNRKKIKVTYGFESKTGS